MNPNLYETEKARRYLENLNEKIETSNGENLTRLEKAKIRLYKKLSKKRSETLDEITGDKFSGGSFEF